MKKFLISKTKRRISFQDMLIMRTDSLYTGHFIIIVNVKINYKGLPNNYDFDINLDF